MGSFKFMTLADGHEVHSVGHFPKCEFKLIYHCRCHEITQLELHHFKTTLNAQFRAVYLKNMALQNYRELLSCLVVTY